MSEVKEQEMQRAVEVNVLLRRATNNYLSTRNQLERKKLIDFVEYRSFKSVQVATGELSFEQALESCFNKIDQIIADEE